jgi:hypothetical protein
LPGLKEEGKGVAGTVELLRRSLAPGGIMLIGEPYWRKEPPDQETVQGCNAAAKDEWKVGWGDSCARSGTWALTLSRWWGVFALMDR